MLLEDCHYESNWMVTYPRFLATNQHHQTIWKCSLKIATMNQTGCLIILGCFFLFLFFFFHINRSRFLPTNQHHQINQLQKDSRLIYIQECKCSCPMTLLKIPFTSGNTFEIVSLKIELSTTESVAGTPQNDFLPRICVQSLKPSSRILQDACVQKEERTPYQLHSTLLFLLAILFITVEMGKGKGVTYKHNLLRDYSREKTEEQDNVLLNGRGERV